MICGTAAINKVPEYAQAFEKVLAIAPEKAGIQLVPEPTNPYDSYAVKVVMMYQVGIIWDEVQIGYVKKSDQSTLYQQFGPEFFQKPRFCKIVDWGRFPTESTEALFLNFEVL